MFAETATKRHADSLYAARSFDRVSMVIVFSITVRDCTPVGDWIGCDGLTVFGVAVFVPQRDGHVEGVQHRGTPLFSSLGGQNRAQ